ncbi:MULTISPECIES: type IV secretion protein DotL [Acinetobacter]|uniref:type IV secretion protein DotL n=1 Tax=Acinetobacter TaxID=469 RepID=UPI0005C4B7A5|nr:MULTISPECIES: type IV secretion protein DotL [Acinetobacter]
MASTQKYGTQTKFRPSSLKRDTRSGLEKIHLKLTAPDGANYLVGVLGAIAVILFVVPFGGEIFIGIAYYLLKRYTHPNDYFFEWPFRAPLHSNSLDASTDITSRVKDDVLDNPKAFLEYARNNRDKLQGEGVTYLGRCRETGLPVYASNSDDRTHQIVLGTTGSGKTEYMLGNCANQYVQNSGYIFVDAKGDTKAQQDHYRLCNRFGRNEDLLTINFITSGRNMLRAQTDKMTNSMNQMSNTSSGMLIEFLINLLDDSGGGGGDMWKGRAMAFIAALTRVLVYLRDNGFIQLSPKVFTQYMELEALEELVFCHNDKYGIDFERVAEQLQGYLVSLPGYSSNPKKLKKQETKTREQHGYITMQLTKAINDLTFNYGHIFGVEHGGDIDIFDVVLNRRILTVPLPALERSPDSLKMLGKLIIGSIKQMMAGSLGNKMEGLRRAIIDARPTNATTSFKLFLDEWGYIVIVGASVLPAQARSLNFSITFGAQTFEDIERGSKEEAAATWGNTTVKAIGRTTSGAESTTYKLVDGFAGEEWQGKVNSINMYQGLVFNRSVPQTEVQFAKEKRVTIEQIAGQHNGEFTLLISTKGEGGKTSDVKIVSMLAFYVAGAQPKYLRLNDLCPIFNIQKSEIYDPTLKIEDFIHEIEEKHTLLTDNNSSANVTALGDFEICRKLNNTLYENNNTVKDFTQDFVHQILEARRLESITPEGMAPGQRTVMSSSTAKGEISKEQKHRESIVSAQKEANIKDQIIEKRKQFQYFGKDSDISPQVQAGAYNNADLDAEFNIYGERISEPEQAQQESDVEAVTRALITPMNLDSYYDELKEILTGYDLTVAPITEYQLVQMPRHVKPEDQTQYIAENKASLDQAISHSTQNEMEFVEQQYAAKFEKALMKNPFSHECVTFEKLLVILGSKGSSASLRSGITIKKKDD